jgi:hydroxymethylpyrimidine/phosphomethylpyrimidine kinase
VQNQPSPLILTFGPADPVGALGIQSDMAVFAMHGCHGLSVVTGLLVADSARVEDMQPIESASVVEQARMLLEDMPVAAIKVGTMANLEQIAAIAEIVSDYAHVPLILDPFTSALPDCGVRDDDVLTLIHQLLVPQAHVLVTGIGGGDGVRADNLYDADGLAASLSWAQHLPGPFLGAGATLSAALAARMAQGLDAVVALAYAQEYTAGALQHARRFGMGRLIPNKLYQMAPAAAASPSNDQEEQP